MPYVPFAPCRPTPATAVHPVGDGVHRPGGGGGRVLPLLATLVRPPPALPIGRLAAVGTKRPLEDGSAIDMSPLVPVAGDSAALDGNTPWAALATSTPLPADLYGSHAPVGSQVSTPLAPHPAVMAWALAVPHAVSLAVLPAAACELHSRSPTTCTASGEWYTEGSSPYAGSTAATSEGTREASSEVALSEAGRSEAGADEEDEEGRGALVGPGADGAEEDNEEEQDDELHSLTAANAEAFVTAMFCEPPSPPTSPPEELCHPSTAAHPPLFHDLWQYLCRSIHLVRYLSKTLLEMHVEMMSNAIAAYQRRGCLKGNNLHQYGKSLRQIDHLIEVPSATAANAHPAATGRAASIAMTVEPPPPPPPPPPSGKGHEGSFFPHGSSGPAKQAALMGTLAPLLVLLAIALQTIVFYRVWDGTRVANVAGTAAASAASADVDHTWSTPWSPPPPHSLLLLLLCCSCVLVLPLPSALLEFVGATNTDRRQLLAIAWCLSIPFIPLAVIYDDLRHSSDGLVIRFELIKTANAPIGACICTAIGIFHSMQSPSLPAKTLDASFALEYALLTARYALIGIRTASLFWPLVAFATCLGPLALGYTHIGKHLNLLMHGSPHSCMEGVR